MINQSFFAVFALIVAILAVFSNAGYTVISPFPDKYNMQRVYQPGEKLPSWFSSDRIAKIVADGLAVSDGAPVVGYASSP